MSIEQWSDGHRAVLEAFRKHLPDGDDLKKTVSGLDRGRRRIRGREESYAQYGAAVVEELGENAGALLVDFLTKPAEHHIPMQWNDEDALLNKAASVLAGVYCEQHPTPQSADALITRLKAMFNDPQGACEMEPSWNYSEQEFVRRYLFPRADHCVKILQSHLSMPTMKAFFLSCYRGEFNRRIDHGEEAYERYEDSCNSFIGYEEQAFDSFIQTLFEANEFDYDWFEKAAKLYPAYVRESRLFPDEDDDRDEGTSKAFLDTYRGFVARLLKDEIARLPESAEYLAKIVDYTTASGIEWMQLGLQSIETLGLKAKDLKDEYKDLAKVVLHLIAIRALDEGETEQDLEGMLSAFKEPLLLIVLPYAGCARNAILRTLGWDDLLTLQKTLFGIAHGHPGTTESLTDISNCDSTESGVIDRVGVAEALAGVDSKRLMKYVRALRASSLEITNSLMLVIAVAGLERDKIEKKLVRHGQAAIKAYGLYPVVDEAELRERYLKFQAMHKDATQYGPERQANTQAAVKAGLKNLAQSAGYADDIRLEWAMEADIATNNVPFDQDFPVEAWSVKLILEGITPRIQVSKQGKLLKSVPPKVRKTDIYKEMRAAQDNIRGQASRFRKTLEDMMCSGEILSAEELATLSRLPVVGAMLSQLIMMTTDGRFGLFSGTETALTDLQGKPLPIDANLGIAHVYHLFQAGVLAAWQKAIVKRRLVQPFKQAFRELYVVTPAEVEAGSHSRRFVGHVIDSSVASRLLQSRAWTQANSDVVEVYKRFPAHGMYAEIGFPDSRHYLAEEPSVTIDEVWFHGKGGDLPLETIDPIIFSEVMRDVDLLASVAQVDDDDVRWSTETQQRRTELITTLVNDIGLKQVRCEGHFAYIEGSRANYRIHLGSGVTHIQPGNYLCIVPERKKDEPLYLPFADTDLRMAEILSKIFLLVSDDKITDKTILEQIQEAEEG